MEYTNAYVELKDITKTYGDFKASDHVSFSIEKGRLIGLLGPSGSGKTTILRILAGLESADSGAIYIDGRQVDVFVQKLYLVGDGGADGKEPVEVIVNEALSQTDSMVI